MKQLVLRTLSLQFNQNIVSFHSTYSKLIVRYNKKDDHVTEQISEIVDFSILMTYDYSSKQHKLGSNAPMSISFFHVIIVVIFMITILKNQ